MGEAYRYDNFGSDPGEVMVYCATVRSSSETTKKELPEGVTSGYNAMVVDVDTGKGDEDAVGFDEVGAACSMRADEDAMTMWSDSGVDEGRTVTAVGEGVLAGKEIVDATLLQSGDNR